jgi:erythromycin esterase
MLNLLLGAIALAAAQPPIRLSEGSSVTLPMAAGDVRDALLDLRAGESADLVVLQQGIDVIVDAYAPDGTLLDSIDSPNGRQGDEPVSLFAGRPGAYRIRIRPLSAREPAASVVVRVVAVRNRAQTRRLLAQRQRARSAAAAWLRRNSSPLPAHGRISPSDPVPAFDRLAAEARILGLGEATHGSRELNDVRLALVRRLIRTHGYRLIAVEDSTSRWQALEPYLSGETVSPEGPLEWGWIGRRARRALLEWVRGWNVEHPRDRVRIIGVDPQDNRRTREQVGAFLEQAYGSEFAATWRDRVQELANADEQTRIFGNSDMSSGLRSFLEEVAAKLSADGPLLRRRFDARRYDEALAGARDLAAFADFNNVEGAIPHPRDWYMALAIAAAIERDPARPKAVYWAHNAHVATAATRWGPTGAVLRQAFGCEYRAVATTFGRGAFIAQLPGDPEHRMAATSLPAATDQTIEAVLALVEPGAHLSAWDCPAAPEAVPEWLRADRPLHWIGGVYAPDNPSSLAFQPYRLTAAFDAIAYFPTVVAEELPVGAVVPPRVDPAP